MIERDTIQRMLTATEFAHGLAHGEHPLLSPTDHPAARMPATDFSPWLRERLVADDRVAVLTYVLQMVEANPGVGVTLTVDEDVQMMLGSSAILDSDQAWVRDWRKRVERMLDLPLDGLVGVTPVQQLDLRTLLIVMTHGATHLDEYSGLRQGVGHWLAAVMASSDVHLADESDIAAQVTRIATRQAGKHQRTLANNSSTSFGLDLTPVDPSVLRVPALTTSPPVALTSPALGVRLHLAELATKLGSGPQSGRLLRAKHATRTLGSDTVQNLKFFVHCGYLTSSEDWDAAWLEAAAEPSIATLRKYLRQAGAQPPRGASHEELIEMVRRDVRWWIDRKVCEKVEFEFTDEGADAARWVAERVRETTPMWQAWLSASLV